MVPTVIPTMDTIPTGDMIPSDMTGTVPIPIPHTIRRITHLTTHLTTHRGADTTIPGIQVMATSHITTAMIKDLRLPAGAVTAARPEVHIQHRMQGERQLMHLQEQ